MNQTDYSLRSPPGSRTAECRQLGLQCCHLPLVLCHHSNDVQRLILDSSNLRTNRQQQQQRQGKSAASNNSIPATPFCVQAWQPFNTM